MAKSLRMMEESVKLVDIIFYVVDARAPKSCINPAFEPIIKGKKIVFVLNKADLVSENDLAFWVSELKKEGDEAIALVGTSAKSTLVLSSIAKRLCKDKLDRFEGKGIKATIRAMVIGVPNSGKSTLINSLCKKASALTGNKAGVTRGKQWVRINDYFEVLDTPGTLYRKLSDEKAALRLAYIGSIKDEVVDKNELALCLIGELISIDPNIVKNKYKVQLCDDKLLIMSDIARSRGHILKGNEPDIDRTSVALIDDFRKGRLGKICLDRK